MRVRTLARLGIYVALFVVLQGAKCPSIPSTKQVKMTIVAQNYIEFTFLAQGDLNYHAGNETIDIEDLRQDLDDAGVELADVDSVVISQVLYGVTAYRETETDREIVDGTVTLSRTDESTSATIFESVDQPVYPLLGELVPAPLAPGGVDYINALLTDVLQALKYGGPSEFVVSADASGTSEPQGRETDFDWRVRVYYQVIGRADVEVPDF
jgi:hypothetical protein